MKVKNEKTVNKRRMRDVSDDFPSRELCCCPPRALVWIDSRTSSIFVDNKIDMKRRLQVRADANASIRPPGGPDTNADGSGGSQLDEGTLKEQGKIYRTDIYTIHWKAEGQCRPLRVMLSLEGAITNSIDCLPEEGELTQSVTYILEPPHYIPPGSDSLTATLNVQDCTKQVSKCQNMVKRP